MWWFLVLKSEGRVGFLVGLMRDIPCLFGGYIESVDCLRNGLRVPERSGRLYAASQVMVRVSHRKG